MKCVVCKNGITADGTATLTLERNGATLVFKDVPARVCENCGEEYVSEDVTKRVLSQAEEALQNGVELDVRHYRAA
jgi:YgiT-type zinc finger domain-containing protein